MSCHIEDKDTESVEHARMVIDKHAETYYYEMVGHTLDFWGVLKEVCYFNISINSSLRKIVPTLNVL